MGGCASKPKDLDAAVPAPAEAPTTVGKPESQTVEQEKNGGETEKAEPLLDLSDPAEETPEKEDTTKEPKPAERPAEESQPEAATTAPAPNAETTASIPNELQNSDDKSDAPLVIV
ncbi:hypothetical protein Nepgr_010928 [Nepenthes gracilis]|uniref:Uncharacterized protein n=1 Tax=Nepenthes gracilis TaxID=150966 RepID=A0AAD3XLH0_NEPGR|nr:hypothetical protein Nepgr_010928 [Nepenthes gracilis]